MFMPIDGSVNITSTLKNVIILKLIIYGTGFNKVYGMEYLILTMEGMTEGSHQLLSLSNMF